ncbi:acetyl-CoA synthetase-like protein [Cryphonectria parasitica EP155]|uniref:Acetyl-CoA synthetase-like protein n=1 Tax=Cryphonectria parasitica (strain ATCC 38755 / EP155) TaxID=660469 RepID=A0A9P5CRA0_CRYP1|nr:acetyl-CoA synthetase-like protein [Cryphonectria parasitica EP155]KAF3767061.1 acetyl-CoA synthetase-like protein [Cryphonectria parasitica EP155]
MWKDGKDFPADCGRRLLPAYIDQRAREEPNSPWCSLPIDDYDLSKGFEDISIGRFANAINKLAWFIDSTIGKSTSFETVAYLGVADIRYHMIQMAVCKTGHKVLFSSQVNSKAVHLSLMEQTDCKAFLSALGVHVRDILADRPMKHAVIPELDDLLDADEVPHWPYTKTYEEAEHDPYVVLHTSGTTGDPKPIVWNHRFMATQDRQLLLDDVQGRKHCLLLTHPGEGVRYLLNTSPAHAISAGFMMCLSVFGRAIVIPGFRHHGVSPSDLCQILPQAKVTKGIMTPWMMEDLSRRPDAGDFIRPFEHVCFGGAVLSKFAASVWAKHTKIQNAWGATESLFAPQLEADNEDFEYNYFDVFTEGYEFRHVENADYVSEEGLAQELYEFVMVITEKSAPIASWHARQDIDPSTSSPPYPEWRTGDLWTPHPDPAKAKFAWKFVCRKDDLISFSTGVNGHPGPIERSIISHPKARAAILVGAMHQQPLALIELTEGVPVSRDLAVDIWNQAIQPANEKAQMHIRVAKTHVLLVPAGEFVRTAKGSTVRKLTEAKFKEAIDEVYERFGDKWQDAKDRYGSISQETSITVEISTDGEATEKGA